MNLQSVPHFTVKLIHCPIMKAENGQCTGMVYIYAYLQVAGDLVEIINVHGVTQRHVRQVNDKILPQFVKVPFMVIDRGSPGTDYHVEKCPSRDVEPQPPTGTDPVQYHDSASIPPGFQFTRVGNGSGTLTNHEKCLKVDVKFRWAGGPLTVVVGGGGSASGGGTAGVSTSPGGIGVSVSLQGGASTSGSAGAGTVSPKLPVNFEICPECLGVPPGDVTDGEAVYIEGGIFT
jgi:hypothetical protein